MYTRVLNTVYSSMAVKLESNGTNGTARRDRGTSSACIPKKNMAIQYRYLLVGTGSMLLINIDIAILQYYHISHTWKKSQCDLYTPFATPLSVNQQIIICRCKLNDRLAQLDKASAYGAEDWGFESLVGHIFFLFAHAHFFHFISSGKKRFIYPFRDAGLMAVQIPNHLAYLHFVLQPAGPTG